MKIFRFIFYRQSLLYLLKDVCTELVENNESHVHQKRSVH